jgi:hypothetical protein
MISKSRRKMSLALAATCAAALAAACSSSDSSTPGGAGGGGAGGPCPGSDCAYASSACLAIGDNTGATRVQLRMMQLVTTAPPALTEQFVEDTILNKNLRVAYDTCPLYGTGEFSWLFDWDTTTGKLTMGGGALLPNEAAAKAGTCFLHFTDPQSGITVAPKTADSTVGADGKFDVTFDDVVVIPIFLNPQATSYVLLPLHKLHVRTTQGGMLMDNAGHASPTGNCIGAYRGADLPITNDVYCLPDDNYSYFEPGAELDGYVTVDESDTVWVQDLKESLCVLLSDDPATYKDVETNKCKRDGDNKITLKGDWDSATNTAKPGGDSFHLVAKFAASAVKIKGTATQFDCSDAQ